MSYRRGEPVSRLRATLVADPYSGEATRRDWGTPATLSLRAAVADSGSVEPTEPGRTPVDSDFTLYFDGPNPVDVLAGDRVVVRGLTCDVAGRPFFWRSPLTGWAPGTVVHAKIREG